VPDRIKAIFGKDGIHTIGSLSDCFRRGRTEDETATLLVAYTPTRIVSVAVAIGTTVVTAVDRGRVIVTGASSGIGEATALHLHELGFSVLAGVRRDEDAERLREHGLTPVQLDVTVPAQLAADALISPGFHPHGWPLVPQICFMTKFCAMPTGCSQQAARAGGGADRGRSARADEGGGTEEGLARVSSAASAGRPQQF
jgi:hypothetical protein